MPKKNTPHFLMMISLILITNYLTLGMNITSSSMIEEEEERPRRLKNKIKKDINRYMGISERLKLRSKTRKLIDEEEEIPIEERQEAMKSIIDGAVKLPMYAAAEYEMGEYVVDIEVGNPPTKLHLVVDTASDLTWVKCKTHNFGILDEKNVLDLDNSLTYQPISCHHSLCKEDFAPLSALEDCPTSNSPCMYNYSYGDAGLSTYGMFGKEMITLPTTTGKPVVLENLLVGCSESYTDKDRMKKADGVLGLGINPYSFSVHAVTLLGGCFSYCLVDHLSPLNITNYLIFGNYREKSPTQDYMRFTTLQVSESAPYFWVNVKGISIDDKMLDIDPMVWDSNTEGGTILDSGTAATYWATPAYRAIMDVLIPVLEKDYPKLPEGLGDGKLDFEYCFNSTKTPFKPKKVPRLGIHFRDGARFTPLVKSYIVDDGPGVNCIGFLEAPAGLNIIGNIMQQNYLWEFDLQQNTVGFAASVCK